MEDSRGEEEDALSVWKLRKVHKHVFYKVA